MPLHTFRTLVVTVVVENSSPYHFSAVSYEHLERDPRLLDEIAKKMLDLIVSRASTLG